MLGILSACLVNTTLVKTVGAQATVEEVSVFSERIFSDTTVVSPTSKITAQELEAINMMTAEDAVAFEPSLVIRRRFVGDPNGVVGIRGAGMFQTARSMVFADGLPLHYLLQTRFSGSPRWSLVGPDEIESVEVIYGPYSAEYSGNAMGGVIDIKTRTPQKRRFTVQGTIMSQDYDQLGTDESFSGNKIFLSYEDKIGDFNIFASYNRLANKSQPMTNYSLDAGEAADLDAAGVIGYIKGKDDEGEDVIYIGDSGAETSETELYKIKLGYDLGSVQLRGTIAYEKRVREENNKRNYLSDSSSNIYWDATPSTFEERFQDRNSLLLGFGVSGELANDWVYDIYATDFEIRKDEERRTGLNTDDPNFGSRNGRLTEYKNTGWNTLDIKLGTNSLLDNDNMRLSVGLMMDKYELEIDPSNFNAATGEFISERSESRGKTATTAAFAQWGLAISSAWDLALGLRYEDWETSGGLYNVTVAEDRTESGLSPKLSIAYMPSDQLTIRYSVAKALRFPIAEELYRNEETATNSSVSDASLVPEDGVFQNLSIERMIDDGFVRVNFFHEIIDDAIFNQRGEIDNVSISTFLSLDEIETKGVEFIYHQKGLFATKLSARFNVSYTDAAINKNVSNINFENNELPRIPEYRANLILSYPVIDAVDISTSFRYANDSFGDLDNTDTEDEVYGAIDDYMFVNAKVSWRINKTASVSFGVDNIFDDLAYIVHPWPSRTMYLEGKYSF
ncbi:MAG: iron complex outermembrane receptor protein [Pseudohongiellaceae bacterium]|jgi:iron complex outermembrane receptor protein